MANSGFFDALVDEASQEDFLQRELAGSAPQYDPEGGWQTAKNIGRMAAEMTPPGAAASAAGYMGEPSLFQNIGSGDYGTAALQAAGLVPGIGWIGKAGRAGKALRAAERASEVIPPSVSREIGATPRGWDVAGPRRATPMIEGSVSESDPFFGIRRTDRMRPWKERVFPEPRLNPEGVPSQIGGGGPSSPVPPVGPRRSVNYTSETPLLPYTNYSPRLSTELNTNIADLIRNIRAEGRAPNRFEQNMIDRYFSGMQGQAAAEAMANMPVTVVPRGVQRTLNAMREGRKPTSLEMSNLRKHFAGRTGLKSRAALDRVGMDRDIIGPYPEFRAGMSDRVLPAEEIPASGGRESLVRRAMNIASRVAPSVGEGMIAGGLGGMGAYLAARNMGENATPPVVPVVTREERQPVTAAVAPRDFPEFPMTSGPLGTEFDSGKMLSKDVPEPKEAPRPPRRPATTTKERPVTPRHAAPKRAAPQRQRDTGKRYYGDWRDTEPFASDPIGQFIDELTGQRKMARRPGRQAPSSGGLGDLLPFADGGTVRRPFADGGADRIPILSDIGDALGGLMQGGEQPVVAADRSAPAGGGENIFERWSNNPLSQYLFAAGLGMMASPQTHPLMAIGEGGLRGLEYMQAVQANAEARRREKQAAAERRQQLEFLKTLDQPQEQAVSEVVPSKTSEAEPEVASPAVAPVKTAEVESAAKPETPTHVAPSAPTPVVASDNKIENLYNINNKILRAMPFITDPAARSALVARQKAVEAEINRAQREREKAIEDARINRGLQLQEKRLKLEEEYKAPENVRERAAAETAGKTQNERIKEIDQAAVVADSTLKQIKDVIGGYETGDIHTSPKMFEIFKTLQGLGYEFTGPSLTNWALPPKSIENTETLAKLGVADLLGKLKGSLGNGVSEGDRKIIETQALGIDKSPTSNIKALRNLEKLMQRAIEVQKFTGDYLDKYGALDKDFEAALSLKFGKKRLGLEEPEISEKPKGSKRPEGLTDEDIRKEIERRRGAGG